MTNGLKEVSLSKNVVNAFNERVGYICAEQKGFYSFTFLFLVSKEKAKITKKTRKEVATVLPMVCTMNEILEYVKNFC